MTATLSTESKSMTFEIPQWLQQCLLNNQTESEKLICRAFSFAHKLHEGQIRKSGEAYIAHPVAVAGLLRDLGDDSAMIAAGFLHDVVEDTDVTIEEIENLFGTQVRQLVEGVTKLSKLNFSSKTESQAENFRRMFLAMAKDIRVIVVKLADRLHNMRTLQYLNSEKQKRIAQETKDIFAPLANRLGLWRFKWELEDLAFKYLEPESYREIQQYISEKRIDRETRIEQVVEILRPRLNELGIKPVEIKGRPKHLYGIYQKMQRQQKEFNEIYDLAGVRIILEKEAECYTALAVVHNCFKPIPGRFKDYIGLPKANRYQSIHTSVVGLNGRPLEVQIRTETMHRIAEYGIAAHWKYKETGKSNIAGLSTQEEKLTWLRQILEWPNDLKDANEYMQNIKENLFDDDVYVFTPKGDVIALRRSATPVDFGYRIHTDVGNRIKGVKINGRWSVLSTELQNGDIVEIITSNNSHPSLDWLNFVVTPTAKNRIRQWFKRSNREQNIARGRELLEKELGKSGLEALLKSASMQTVAEQANYQKVEDLLAALGYGEITRNQVVNRLAEINKAKQVPELPTVTPQVAQPTVQKDKASKEPICGVEGMLYHIAACCHPIPGEPIIGFVCGGGKGIAIHTQGCHNLENVSGDRLIPASWNPVENPGRHNTYPVGIQVEVLDRVGVFRDILDRLSNQNINVSKAGVKTFDNKPALIYLTIDVVDRPQFEDILKQIRRMSDVLNIRRF